MSSFLDLSSGQDCIEEYERLQNANKQLNQTNIELFKELTILRSENKNLKEIGKSYEKIQNQNSVYAKDIEKIQKENENLKMQVQESQQIINVLREVQLPEKEILKPKRRTIDKEKSIQQVTPEHQNQIDQLTQDNAKLLNEIKKLRSQNFKKEQINVRLIDAFDIYFKVEFGSIENLLGYVQKQIKENKNVNEKSKEAAASLKTNKELKDDLLKQKQLKNSMMEEYENYKKQMESEKSQLQAALQSIEMSANELKQETKLQEMRMQQEMALKDQKIIALENDNKRLKQQLNDINQSLSTFPSQSCLVQQSSDKDKYEQYNAGKDIAAQMEINNLKNEISKVNSLKSQCDAMIEQKNNEIFQLKIDKDDYEMKYYDCFSQLEIQKGNNKQLEIEIHQVTKEKEAIMERNQKFEKLLHNQQTELEELSNCKNRLSTLVYTLKSSFDAVENVTSQLKSDNDKIHNKYEKIKNVINGGKKKEQQIYDVIPITAWYCKDFDDELCSKISEYAQNDGYSSTVKLRNVFKLIVKHYNSKIALVEQETMEKCKKDEDENSIIDQFLESIGAQLNIQNFNSKSVSNPEELAKFRETLSTLINECLSLRKENEDQKNTMNMITDKLGIPSDKIVEQIDSYINTIDNMSHQLEKSKNKCCLLKKQQKQSNECLMKMKAQWYQNSQKQKAIISKLKNKLNSISKEHERDAILQKDNENDIIDAKTEQLTAEIDQKNEEISSLHKKIYQLNDELLAINTQLNNKEKENQEQKNDIIKLNDDVEFWKQSLDTFKKVEMQKEAEFQKIHNNYVETQEKLKENDKKEKDTMIQQYDALIEKQKSKNVQLKMTIDQLRETISTQEATIQKLGKEKLRILHEYQKMTSQFDARNENINRQQEIDMQKLMAIQMANETKSHNIIEEIKTKNDSEKKEIFSYAIKLFRNYYDGSEQINKKVFKETLSKANDELQKLLKQDESIRYILGITKNDSIENNVTSILMKNYNQ